MGKIDSFFPADLVLSINNVSKTIDFNMTNQTCKLTFDYLYFDGVVRYAGKSTSIFRTDLGFSIMFQNSTQQSFIPQFTVVSASVTPVVNSSKSDITPVTVPD